MKKILFPIFKERHRFLLNNWWFRFIIVIYVVSFAIAPFLIFFEHMYSSTDWCYESLPLLLTHNDRQSFNEELDKCTGYAKEARIESLILALGGTLMIHYLIQIIFFKIVMDYIVLGGRQNIMQEINNKRNPAVFLELSLSSAQEFFKKLCEVNTKLESLDNNFEATIEDAGFEEFKNLRTLQRAFWIALIIEIGRLFDTYEKNNKKVISFKQIDFFQTPNIKTKIDSIHGEAIISKIINTRNTFIGHMGKNKESVISVPEICASKLGSLLDQLNEPMKNFASWYRNNSEQEKK